MAAAGASPGVAATSAGVVIGNSVPTATAVAISGTPAVGQTLTGSYTYGDVDSDAEGTEHVPLAAQRRGDWRRDRHQLRRGARGPRRRR